MTIPIRLEVDVYLQAPETDPTKEIKVKSHLAYGGFISATKLNELIEYLQRLEMETINEHSEH